MSHTHEHPSARYDRAFAVGIGLNAAFVAVEAAAGWYVNSLALLADAAHNLGDVAGLALAWAGTAASRVRPRGRYTYGWKRATILAAFVNASLLLAAMLGLSWEAFVRLLRGSAAAHAPTVMSVAGAGIVVNSATALLFLRGQSGDLNVRGAFLHMAADALVSVGVVAAGLAELATGSRWCDPAASLVVAGVVMAAAGGLLRRSLHLLFDGVPANVDLDAVNGYLASLPGVDGVHDLHVWALGTLESALTAQLVMKIPPEGDDFLKTATHALHERFGIDHVTLQIVREPFTRACGAPAQ